MVMLKRLVLPSPGESELLFDLIWFGFNATKYAGLSYRIGAATTAVSLKLPAWLIKTLGRWPSDCFERYINTHTSRLSMYQMYQPCYQVHHHTKEIVILTIPIRLTLWTTGQFFRFNWSIITINLAWAHRFKRENHERFIPQYTESVLRIPYSKRTSPWIFVF